MRQATSALIAFIAANYDAVVEDLYTFSLVGGSTLRYGSGPLQRTIPAANFPGSLLNYAGSGNQTFGVGPRFGRSKITVKIGTEPAELDITIDAGASDMIGNFTWQGALEAGLFDYATVELDRFFMPQGSDGVMGPVNTSLGAVVWFYGRVADVDFGRSTLAMKVRSMMNLVSQQQMPRRLFQSACTHIFGDAMCGYNRTAGTNALGTSTGIGAVSVTAGAGSTAGAIITGYTPSPTTAYDQGSIVGTSGANAGLTRTISNLASGTANLRTAFPSNPTTGDGFTLLPGCDHTLTTCNNVLQNLARYGGMPYIPPPELAL